jgi:hypothetical protein
VGNLDKEEGLLRGTWNLHGFANLLLGKIKYGLIRDASLFSTV